MRSRPELRWLPSQDRVGNDRRCRVLFLMKTTVVVGTVELASEKCNCAGAVARFESDVFLFGIELARHLIVSRTPTQHRWCLSPGPPTIAVLPSAESATPSPCIAPFTLPGSFVTTAPEPRGKTSEFGRYMVSNRAEQRHKRENKTFHFQFLRAMASN